MTNTTKVDPSKLEAARAAYLAKQKGEKTQPNMVGSGVSEYECAKVEEDTKHMREPTPEEQAEAEAKELAEHQEQMKKIREGAISFRNEATLDDLAGQLYQKGAPYPFPTLTELTGGQRMGELSVMFAGTGVGKTTISSNNTLHLLMQGESVLAFSLEDQAADVAIRLASRHAGVKLESEMFEGEGAEVFNNALIAQRKEALKSLFQDESLGEFYCPKNLGTMSFEEIVAMIIAYAEIGVKYFVLDNLTSAISRVDQSRSQLPEYIILRNLAAQLAVIAQKLKINIAVIAHAARGMEGFLSSTDSMSGGKGVNDSAMLVTTVFRAKMPVTTLDDGSEVDHRVIKVLKCRDRGQSEGKMVGIDYHFSDQSLSENPEVLEYERWYYSLTTTARNALDAKMILRPSAGMDAFHEYKNAEINGGKASGATHNQNDRPVRFTKLTDAHLKMEEAAFIAFIASLVAEHRCTTVAASNFRAEYYNYQDTLKKKEEDKTKKSAAEEPDPFANLFTDD